MSTKVISRYVFLWFLILKSYSAEAQNYSFDLALRIDSSKAKALNIKETIGIHAGDTLLLNKYDASGNLIYTEKTDSFKKLKTIDVYHTDAVWNRKEQFGSGYIKSDVTFKDGTILKSEIKTKGSPPDQFKFSKSMLEIAPQLERLEPYLKKVYDFNYNYKHVDNYGDTALVNVRLSSVNQFLNITKNYGLCFDSTTYIEYFYFKLPNLDSYTSNLIKNEVNTKNEVYHKKSTFKNGELNESVEKDLRNNSITNHTFNIDSFPSTTYTIFDTCNKNIPKVKYYFHEGQLFQYIEYENYPAQGLEVCLCWNALHFDKDGNKIKKEKFLRDRYYLYKDSLWYNINSPFKSKNYSSSIRCGSGNEDIWPIPEHKESISVGDFYDVSANAKLSEEAIKKFQAILEEKFEYPPILRDVAANFTDTLTITANNSLTKVYEVSSKHSKYNNQLGEAPDFSPKYSFGKYFLLNGFNEVYPESFLTEVIIFLNDGTKKVLKPPKEDNSRITFKVNAQFRIKLAK